MSNIINSEHKESAIRFRELLAKYIENEDLINIGAYKRGTSKEIDEAIRKYPQIIEFLKQRTDEAVTSKEGIQALINLIGSVE